jgi:hypothetical protein
MPMFHSVKADFIGAAVDTSAADACPGLPDAEAKDVMITPTGTLSAWGATKFGGKDD